jgi:aspartyl-tRNA(Asn)/glutamyl-tRNA(Gln) amidotransferase subunit C
MALTIEEVRKIAALARLRFTPEEEAVYGKIVDYIDQLQGYESASEGELSLAVQEADDRPHETLPRPLFLANTPASLDGFLLVPVVKGNSPDGDDLA